MPSKKRNNNECDSIHEAVMQRLQEDRVTIKPRIYHIAGSVLVGMGIAGTILSSVFFTHVVLYKIRAEHLWGVAGFGAHGVWAFITYFPWPALLLSIVGLVGGARLLKEYDVGCKHRLSRVIIAGSALIVSCGFMLEYVDFGSRIRSYSLVETLYREQMPIRIIEGKVVRMSPRRLVVQDRNGDTIHLDIRKASFKTMPQVHQRIRALGRSEGSILHVQSLRVISVK